ncbi:hypothetical protein E0J20_09365 [Rhizobium leguminosarum bv. viciae]|nr:hypothetical protein E0J20_09365 [Rhizobium leguminosarum bv. viciae]
MNGNGTVVANFNVLGAFANEFPGHLDTLEHSDLSGLFPLFPDTLDRSPNGFTQFLAALPHMRLFDFEALPFGVVVAHAFGPCVVVID